MKKIMVVLTEGRLFRATLFLLFFFANYIYASSDSKLPHSSETEESHIHGTHDECRLPKRTLDIIECVMEFHPSVKKSQINRDSSKTLIDKARQIPNPIFSSRIVKGEENGNDLYESEASLAFKVELGNKRDARINLAKSIQDELSVHILKEQAQAKIDAILNLHRLRQINVEKKALSETLEAFSKVINKLKKLPRLSAQQEGSLTLFEIAFEETKIHKSEIYEEERRIEHFFHITSGHSLNEITPFLPSIPKHWPKIERIRNLNKVSSEVKRLRALERLAISELDIEKSIAWSDLKIGPSLQIEKDGTTQNTLVGINISLPLPLFNVNGGGKANARSKQLRAKNLTFLTIKEENHERFEQLLVYESALSVLKSIMTDTTIQGKFKRIQNLYHRGVVSSSVFLDSLKQKTSFLESRHRREMSALKSLWEIYKFDGKVFEVKL